MNSPLPLFLEGFGTSIALIMVIGPQNAFVLKQGILKNYIFITALSFAMIDAVLISLGLGSFGAFLTKNPFFMGIARWGGVIYLSYYGIRSFKLVFKTTSLEIGETMTKYLSFKSTMASILFLSFLNPHLYLDTLVLLGSIGGQFPFHERIFFGMGAIAASFIWFFSLAYGARYLIPLFKKPLAWKILDFIVGSLMFTIALSLMFN